MPEQHQTELSERRRQYQRALFRANCLYILWLCASLGTVFGLLFDLYGQIMHSFN